MIKANERFRGFEAPYSACKCCPSDIAHVQNSTTCFVIVMSWGNTAVVVVAEYRLPSNAAFMKRLRWSRQLVVSEYVRSAVPVAGRHGRDLLPLRGREFPPGGGTMPRRKTTPECKTESSCWLFDSGWCVVVFEDILSNCRDGRRRRQIKMVEDVDKSRI